MRSAGDFNPWSLPQLCACDCTSNLSMKRGQPVAHSKLTKSVARLLQKGFGKCEAGFIVNGDYCQATCGRCPQNVTLVESSSPSPMQGPAAAEASLPVSHGLPDFPDFPAISPSEVHFPMSLMSKQQLCTADAQPGKGFKPWDDTYHQNLAPTHRNPSLLQLGHQRHQAHPHLGPHRQLPSSRTFPPTQQLRLPRRKLRWLQTLGKKLHLCQHDLHPRHLHKRWAALAPARSLDFTC